MYRLVAFAAIWLLGTVVVSAAHPRSASPGSASTSSTGDVHEALAAQAEGLVDVRFIPNDSRSAQIIVTNRSNRPLAIRLPAVFAGIPVLAQIQPNNQQGAQGFGGAAQVSGGGAGIGGQMGGGQMFGGCWVAREVYGPHDPRWMQFRWWLVSKSPEWLHVLYTSRGEEFSVWIHDKPFAKQLVRTLMNFVIDTHINHGGPNFQVSQAASRPITSSAFVLESGKTRTFRLTTVCLEHGKPEPTPRRPYRLASLDEFSRDPRLNLVLASLGAGQLPQRVAQAAAWHFADNMSWDELAAKQINHAGGDPDEPYFAPAELLAARRVADLIRRQVADQATSQQQGSGATRQQEGVPR